MEEEDKLPAEQDRSVSRKIALAGRTLSVLFQKEAQSFPAAHREPERQPGLPVEVVMRVAGAMTGG